MSKLSEQLQGGCATLRSLARALNLSPQTVGELADKLKVGRKAGTSKNSPRVFDASDASAIIDHLCTAEKTKLMMDRAASIFAHDRVLEDFRRLLHFAKSTEVFTADHAALLEALEARPQRPAGPVKVTPKLSVFFAWHNDFSPGSPRSKVHELISRLSTP